MMWLPLLALWPASPLVIQPAEATDAVALVRTLAVEAVAAPHPLGTVDALLTGSYPRALQIELRQSRSTRRAAP